MSQESSFVKIVFCYTNRKYEMESSHNHLLTQIMWLRKLKKTVDVHFNVQTLKFVFITTLALA